MRISKNQMIAGIFAIAGVAYGLDYLAGIIGTTAISILLILAAGGGAFYLARRLRR